MYKFNAIYHYKKTVNEISSDPPFKDGDGPDAQRYSWNLTLIINLEEIVVFLESFELW